MKQFAIVAFVAFLALTEAGRVKRAALNNCQTNPSDMDEENSVDDGATFSMSCSTDTKVLTCIWRHTDPISEKNQGSSAGPTILCSGGTDSNGRQCSTDTRLTFRTSENTCAIDISNSKPEDTGRWILTAVTLNSNGLQTQVCTYVDFMTHESRNLSFCSFLRSLKNALKSTLSTNLWLR